MWRRIYAVAGSFALGKIELMPSGHIGRLLLRRLLWNRTISSLQRRNLLGAAYLSITVITGVTATAAVIAAVASTANLLVHSAILLCFPSRLDLLSSLAERRGESIPAVGLTGSAKFGVIDQRFGCHQIVGDHVYSRRKCRVSDIATASFGVVAELNAVFGSSSLEIREPLPTLSAGSRTAAPISCEQLTKALQPVT